MIKSLSVSIEHICHLFDLVRTHNYVKTHVINLRSKQFLIGTQTSGPSGRGLPKAVCTGPYRGLIWTYKLQRESNCIKQANVQESNKLLAWKLVHQSVCFYVQNASKLTYEHLLISKCSRGYTPGPLFSGRGGSGQLCTPIKKTTRRHWEYYISVH